MIYKFLITSWNSPANSLLFSEAHLAHYVIKKEHLSLFASTNIWK